MDGPSDHDFGAPEVDEYAEKATREAEQRPTVITIHPGDQWPEAISDGLTLQCSVCGQVPWLDYRVTDEAWLRNVPSAEQRGVVCLKCYLDRGGSLADVEDIQITGDGETLVAEPKIRYIYRTEALDITAKPL